MGCLGLCGSRALTHSRPAKFLPHDVPAPRAAWVLRVTRAHALASCQACSSASSAAWVPAGHARSRVLASCQVLAMMLQCLRAAWVLRVTRAHARASCQVCRRDRSSPPSCCLGLGGSCTRMRAHVLLCYRLVSSASVLPGSCGSRALTRSRPANFSSFKTLQLHGDAWVCGSRALTRSRPAKL